MISKSLVKLVKSLHLKKFREKEGLFIIEGAKNVTETLMSDFEIKQIFATQNYIDTLNISKKTQTMPVEIVTEKELASIGSFSSNNAAICVAYIKENKEILIEGNEFALVLDDIRDPGNLGTIIRIADWYGIKKIICSETTVDLHNPKTIAASMGSFTRVAIYSTNLKTYLNQIVDIPIFGAFMLGENVHHVEFPKSGLIVLGNESAGISKDIEKLVQAKITIPRYGQAESLNVGIAAAVILDNLVRNRG